MLIEHDPVSLHAKMRHGDHWHQEVRLLLPWAILASLAIGTIAMLAPQQLGVITYALAKISLGALVGYGVDRTAFPLARPEIERGMVHFLEDLRRDSDDVALAQLHRALALHMMRRATIIGLAMIALCLAP